MVAAGSDDGAAVASNIEAPDLSLRDPPPGPPVPELHQAPTLDAGAQDDHGIRYPGVIPLDGRPGCFAGGDQLAGLGCLVTSAGG